MSDLTEVTAGKMKRAAAHFLTVLLCAATVFMLCGCSIELKGGSESSNTAAEPSMPQESLGDDGGAPTDSIEQLQDVTGGEQGALPTVNAVEFEEYTGYPELDELLNDIVQKTQNTTDYLTNELDAFFAAANDSYDGYIQNKEVLANWYALAYSESEKLYESIKTDCEKYHEILLNNPEYAEYKVWDRALGDSYDVWDGALGDYYNDWDDLYGDIYNDCSDMITDAPENVGYDVRSEEWDEMYDTRADSWEAMYDLRADAWESLYDARSDTWDELYDRR